MPRVLMATETIGIGVYEIGSRHQFVGETHGLEVGGCGLKGARIEGGRRLGEIRGVLGWPMGRDVAIYPMGCGGVGWLEIGWEGSGV